MSTSSTASAAPRLARRRWSLQTRLIVAVVSLVTLILIAVGLATGAILRSILVENLDAQISASAGGLRVGPLSVAEDTLSGGRQQTGTLLVVGAYPSTTGAYIDQNDEVVALDDDQIAVITAALEQQRWTTVEVPRLGEYRLHVKGSPSGVPAALGVPTSALTSMVAQILTTVALVTAGGLLVLAAIIALVIRHSLAPLRAVADTASRVAAQPLAEGEVTISERVPADEADERTEIGRVGAALNTLLDHVDSSLTARQRNEERMRSFVADASHELRTPLASIRGYSELSLRGLRRRLAAGRTGSDAASDSVLDEQTEQALERIQAQSLRMTTLVEDLLLLARLDEGQELVFGTVDLSRLAVDAVSDAQVAGGDHEWRVEVGEEPVVVAGDATRLHQVAANLLANARVHTPAGTVVTASVHNEDGVAVLRVHDDGPGIDPVVAASLFERFARADASRARKTGGTGLGLSIAKAIVTAHGGTITVNSSPGSTTFEVRLPAARPPVAAA